MCYNIEWKLKKRQYHLFNLKILEEQDIPKNK